MPNMKLLSDPHIKPYVGEFIIHRRLAAAVFLLTNVIFLGVGFVWPKGYIADTTILAAEKNVIQPLMQGAAVTTGVADRARLARELMNGRQVMNQVIVSAGWVTPDTPDNVKKAVVEMLNRRTYINNLGQNLIRIQFRDTDAERAYRTTKAIAEIFIQESLNAKTAESKSAFDFIDKQTQEYHQKLMAMEEGLKQFRIENMDINSGSDGDLGQRMSALQQRIETSQTELKEAEIRKKSLERQLSGEAEVASVLSREGLYRQRIAELNSKLETLRLSYHDTYPDVVNVRHQIEDLKHAIEEDKQKRDAAKATGQVIIDDSVINNPTYQQLKRDLSQAQITIDTLSARIAEANRQLKGVLEAGKKVHSGEATLAELMRDYQVNRDIYQDLLKRRENARVSMNLDKDNQGLTFKIQDPAELPTELSGLRFIHFIFIGIILGIAIPVGLVIALIHADPRVRIPTVFHDQYQLPVMTVVPHLWNPKEIQSINSDIRGGIVLVVGTFAIIVFAILLRTMGYA
jgi:polysaccharide chain length determinant protein (PEP-CTERM system associated)